MALLRDRNVSSVDDLRAYESDIQEIARAEGINVEAKIRLAQTEIEAELEASGRRLAHDYSGVRIGGSEQTRTGFHPNQVVVTRPLKMWHAYRTLALFFRDAGKGHSKDRMAKKKLEYDELEKWSSSLLFQTGVGVVLNPIPRPKDIVISTSPSGAASASLRVQATWTLGAEEGAPSDARAVTTSGGQSIEVSMPPQPEEEVSGWNVYVADSTGAPSRQNLSPLAIGSTWAMPTGGIVNGESIRDGQLPDVYRSIPQLLWRG